MDTIIDKHLKKTVEKKLEILRISHHPCFPYSPILSWAPFVSLELNFILLIII
jgi:hypothetical protein